MVVCCVSVLVTCGCVSHVVWLCRLRGCAAHLCRSCGVFLTRGVVVCCVSVLVTCGCVARGVVVC